MNETLLLTVIILLGAALVCVSVVMLNTVKSLRTAVLRLEGSVEGLQSELKKQHQNLEAVRAVIQKKPEDPFMQVLQAVDRYRTRGLVPAIAMVGVRLFRSYLSGKARRKALPVLEKSTE